MPRSPPCYLCSGPREAEMTARRMLTFTAQRSLNFQPVTRGRKDGRACAVSSETSSEAVLGSKYAGSHTGWVQRARIGSIPPQSVHCSHIIALTHLIVQSYTARMVRLNPRWQCQPVPLTMYQRIPSDPEQQEPQKVLLSQSHQPHPSSPLPHSYPIVSRLRDV